MIFAWGIPVIVFLIGFSLGCIALFLRVRKRLYPPPPKPVAPPRKISLLDGTAMQAFCEALGGRPPAVEKWVTPRRFSYSELSEAAVNVCNQIDVNPILAEKPDPTPIYTTEADRDPELGKAKAEYIQKLLASR